ncbi:MAG: HEAT repeat domain-containing protein [Planctomycetota bacterium]|nr:HEAT repeat domain-containing protein [Planctomycetota bacterium]
MIRKAPLCFLFALVASAPLAATASAARACEERTVDDSSEMRRVLVLASGQRIRVVSRAVDGRWEYKSKNDWKALEQGAVVAATLESELLLTWNEKRATLDSKNQTQRAQLADWAAGVGLATEALNELEAVLTLDPDSIAAREVLHKQWFFTVPSIRVDSAEEILPAALAVAEEALFRFGAAQTLCGRELATNEFTLHPDRDALQTRLVRELASPIVVRRSFAALALRRIFPGVEVKALMMRSVFDASADVRRGCALGLKAANDPAVCVPIVRALNSKLPIVRSNAAEALGSMGYAAAVEPLVMALAAPQGGGAFQRIPHSNIFIGRQFAYVQDFDVEVAQFQAVADPVVNVVLEGSALDTAVTAELVYSFASDSVVIQNSLAKLTGEMPGRSAKAWLAWWEAKGSKWRSDERSRPKTG